MLPAILTIRVGATALGHSSVHDLLYDNTRPEALQQYFLELDLSCHLLVSPRSPSLAAAPLPTVAEAAVGSGAQHTARGSAGGARQYMDRSSCKLSQPSRAAGFCSARSEPRN